MRIFYPVPVTTLPKDILMQEHFNILGVSAQIEDLFNGIISEDQVHPETLRWRYNRAALYDRYQKSRELLSFRFGVEIIDMWPEECRSDEGAFILYPDDSRDVIEDMWLAVFVATSRLDY